MKIILKPKKVTVVYKEVLNIISEYTCPTCHITFVGFVQEGTVKFICHCGQVLIVENTE